jgi:hypothetical protein
VFQELYDQVNVNRCQNSLIYMQLLITLLLNDSCNVLYLLSTFPRNVLPV